MDQPNPEIGGSTHSWLVCKHPWGVKTSKNVHEIERKENLYQKIENSQ